MVAVLLQSMATNSWKENENVHSNHGMRETSELRCVTAVITFHYPAHLLLMHESQVCITNIHDRLK